MPVYDKLIYRPEVSTGMTIRAVIYESMNLSSIFCGQSHTFTSYISIYICFFCV